MPRLSNQKLKMLYILDMLMRETDDEHSIDAKEIIARLETQGISAERKSVYDDIEQLRLFGYDILLRREAPKGYYMASREFELPELKILVDSVASSKFITERKSEELIKKLEKMTSKYEAGRLQRQVIVSNRIKTVNEAIYYNVDTIHEAMNQGRMISFQYGEWNIEKKLQLRRDGQRYTVSPWGMCWDDENYYMIAYDEQADTIKHYRVDKMLKLEVENATRKGGHAFKEIDMATYAKRIFGMFRGEKETLRIQFDNELVGVVIDRFGQDVTIMKADENHFVARINIELSGQVFGWLAALGTKAKIVEPAQAARTFADYLHKIVNIY